MARKDEGGVYCPLPNRILGSTLAAAVNVLGASKDTVQSHRIDCTLISTVTIQAKQGKRMRPCSYDLWRRCKNRSLGYCNREAGVVLVVYRFRRCNSVMYFYELFKSCAIHVMYIAKHFSAGKSRRRWIICHRLGQTAQCNHYSNQNSRRT